jgi:hypothetical protein
VNLLRKFFDEHTLNLKDLTFQNLNHDTKRKILSDYALNDIKNVMLQNILERKPPLKRSDTLIPLTVKTGNNLEFLNRIILSADNKSVIFFKELSKIGLFFTIDNHGNIDQSSRKIIDFSSSKKISCITFNHDGTKIFLGTMYDDNNNLEVYNLNNGTIGEKIQSIPMPGIGIKKIKLSPSGEKIFVIISAGVSKKEPHTLFEFTTKNGIIDPHPRIFDECQNPDELSLNINDIAINPNGDMTLVASKNFIYMLPSDNTTHQLRLMAKIANNNSISTLAFSPDGNTIALALFNRGIISMKIDNGIINNQSTWIDNAEATSLYFASNNILIASNLQNAQLYDLNKISQEQINIFAARPGIAPLMRGFFDIKLNARCTKIFAIEETRNHNLVCTYFNLITPEEEKMLTDLKNKLTIEEAQLIITLHQELIRGNKVHLSDADNIIYASLPAGIQILFANAIQKD